MVLSLAHNMAQPNQVTAAMIDVLTEFVHDKDLTPKEARSAWPTRSTARAELTLRRFFAAVLPGMAIWPPLILSAGHVVVFTVWTAWLSFTPSTLLPEGGFVGWRNYTSVMATRNFHVAYVNLVIFGVGFVVLTTRWGCCWRSCSTSACAGRMCSARSSSIRWRSRSW